MFFCVYVCCALEAEVYFVWKCCNMFRSADDYEILSYNSQLLSEVNGKWRRYKKWRPIWCQLCMQNKEIHSLEGPLEVKSGQWICRGIERELWVQSEADLLKKYYPTNVYDGKWRKFVPRQDISGVGAVKMKHPFSVKTKHGILHGKAGDYLLRPHDPNEPLPLDLWIVDAQIFKKTYQPAIDSNQIRGLLIMANAILPQCAAPTTSSNTLVLKDNV